MPHLTSRKTLAILGIVLGLAILAFGLVHKSVISIPGSIAGSDNSEILPTAPPAPGVLVPWQLSIPTLNINAAIQKVGKTSDGSMSVASNNTDVAWYKFGPKPGQPGNAVLAGHLNGGPNIPAVFGSLSKLKTGDYVYIEDNEKHTNLRFQVTSTQAYSVDNAPLDKIFGAATGNHLNLITCNGSWDRTSKEYKQRLVVFTKQVDSL